LAQERKVSGTVKDNGGNALPGVSVLVKGTQSGTVTDVDGKFNISVKDDAAVLVFSFIGYKKQEVTVGNQTNMSLTLSEDTEVLETVVVTAMGVSREKKSLGYSVQEVGGESLSETKNTNVVAALSGKVAGVQIKQPSSMGGSANILIRGTSSLGGNNQPLFVIDGVPVDNSTFNASGQNTGRGGYDYGNLASDINPDDVETMSVLKGAAATALYGSRASNGVILVTTKSGKGRRGKGLGVTFNAGITFSKINKETLPEHQKEYGAGYGK
jgi:TonB-dependent SusC/RagA subfamily outer membrane receptor